MELVGRSVSKTFEGFGTFTGIVESYNPLAGYFRVQYEDGDSEDLDFDEIVSIVKEMGEPSPAPQAPTTNQGRRPKKRRRADRSDFDSGADDPTLGEGEVRFDETHSSPDVVMEKNCSVEGGSVDEIQVNGGSGENSSSQGFEETLQMKSHCLVGDSQLNASFGYSDNQGGESASCSSEKDEQTPKKRQKLPGSMKSTRRIPLRRSARRATTASSPMSAIPCTEMLAPDDVVFEEQLISGSLTEDSMPALPPSSTDLDVDGLHVLDLFSVYTCLRSFGRVLFLSPFLLENFVAALRCRFANNLIDSIHFSILQALRSHLKSLAEEGSCSATDCLRNLNWGLLDLVTWPVYLVEYLVTHGRELRSGFKLSYLELLNSEYYKQPAAVKLELLRCLCDDVIEVEAIRSELTRRMVESGLCADANNSMNVDKKCKDSTVKDVGSSFLAQEVVEETADGNIDECCLCTMDGNLICCDGCPAAFHSRCVGVAKDLLPEGEWYCPDCLMEKGDGFLKSSKPFRGAEVLGCDPHGRLYFGSCGYLLVSDSCNTDASYHYYNKSDLNAVIEVLKSSYASYSAIINAISVYCEIPTDASCFDDQHGYGINQKHEDAQVLPKPFSPFKQDVVGDDIVGRTEIINCAPGKCDPKTFEILDSVKLNQGTLNQLPLTTDPITCSEISDEMTKAAACVRVSQQTDPDSSVDCSSPAQEFAPLGPSNLAVGQENYIGLPGWGSISLLTERRKPGGSQIKYDPAAYVNHYSFGRVASSIAEELMKPPFEKNNMESKKPAEDIKLVQLKAISKKSIKHSSYNYQQLSLDVQKEKCGWCFSCRTSSDGDCLFTVVDDKNLEVSKNRMVGLRSGKNRKSHLVSTMHHILLIENNVRSFLSGPWEDPHYFKHWRKAVTRASDVASLRHPLLVLESNLRRVSLSSEWLKPVDSAHAVGLASHILTNSARGSSNHSGSRRPSKKSLSGTEFCFDPHAATNSSIYWWRGGRLTRQVFRWRMLPRSLAYKGGRQAGCRKIPNIIYHDGPELAKRSKSVAWRAAVETSESVAQLICQVKDFESNIRLTEFSENQILLQSNDSKKLARLFKKVTIRRKCIEGADVKYLLDFGRREVIPAVVTKHGVMVEESSSERKKYWLNEIHVPLNLLKSFEEKKLARMLKRKDSVLFTGKGSNYIGNKCKRLRGLSYLLSKEPQSQLCSHCNKDVLIREAVNCQFCNGYFHKKHFRVPKGAITTSYTCCKCKDVRNVNENTQVHEVGSKRGKNSAGKQLQESTQGHKVMSERRKISIGKLLQESTQGHKVMSERRKISIGKLLQVNTQGNKVVSERRKISVGKQLQEKTQGHKVVLSERRKISVGKQLQENTQGHKVVSKMRRVSIGKKLQELPKGGKNVLAKSKKSAFRKKKGRSHKSKGGKSKKSEITVSWVKKKRTLVRKPYWLNGLRWSRESVDERGIPFRERKVLLPSQDTEDPPMQPVCSLCHEKYNSSIIYICCEGCEDWFHGEVFSLALEDIDKLIGFKCSKCRMKRIPMCPYENNAAVAEVQSQRESNDGVKTMSIEQQKDEEKLHGEAYNNCPTIVHCEDLLNGVQREVDLKRPKEELILCCKNIPTDEHITMHTLERAESRAASFT